MASSDAQSFEVVNPKSIADFILRLSARDSANPPLFGPSSGNNQRAEAVLPTLNIGDKSETRLEPPTERVESSRVINKNFEGPFETNPAQNEPSSLVNRR